MIIATKLHIPRSRSSLVVRSRLTRRLHEGLDRTLTLISAPAGYGKTTLLGEWVMTLENPVAWVSLDQGDNDRTRFWAHTIAALKQAYPSFDQQDVLRHAAEDPSGVSLIAALINGLHRISHTMVLVWDDFHHIEETSILQGVTYLLERLPLHVHLYLASRNSPALPLSRLRAENRLISLEASDLRFVPDETTEFFAKCGGIQLSNEDVATVQKKTEGWAVAMRLAVLSMHEHTDPVSLIRKMAGTERDISDYFFDEVLARQSATMQQFLLYTSILDRMKGELCQAVTGIAESHAYLQQLDKESLFLVALDEWREWYRYHHLFRQFLTAQLKMREPRQWQTLHMTAGKWLEENGYPHEAVDHYLAAADYEHALSLIEVMTPELMTNEWTTLCKWLNAIPDTLLFARPMMLLTKLASQYLSGHVEAATDGYWQAVRRLEEDTDPLPPEEAETLQAGLAFLAAFRTFLDRDFEYAVQFSHEYVEKHPEGDFFIEFGSDVDGYHPVWDIYVSDDSLRLAEQVLTSLLSIWSETRNVYFVAHLYIDLGKMQYERNRLVEAEKLMRQAYDIGRLHDHRSLATIAALWLARIATVQGDEATSKHILRELTQLTSKTANSRLSGKIASFRAMLGRMHREEKPVRQWLRKSRLRFRDEIPVSMIKEYDLLASILAEQGKMEEAAALTERLLQLSIEEGRQSDRIRLLVHKSMILSLQGKISDSMDVLEEALALARPEGYIRTFVDEGASLGQLLDQYIRLRQNQLRRPSHKVPLSYVKRLRRLIPLAEREAGTPHDRTLAALTAREQSVLRLMETGMSNKEIALKLNVSLATVKTHINNIYCKLQSKNRLQALERARTLQLF
ncbi:LuxR C-terminal-related transcriptional regulator [Paenibacillus lactis]|uniref:LuxR family maltose regulon positive regulatory protein n=1 Tax=Paenibacillus lactis TaxID=228574 RepID=A0ABS4FHZ1_9BACL|nr:LuxR C-terminal-related transcriptional regulator [Paenibacillus lactis]MBP1895884.1 LuxR family maltose regulon positive regulatory protein [Paenibacillus lactis]HAG01549.1 LuxR family transcriptional regulator [Paenibacillus lactis]